MSGQKHLQHFFRWLILSGLSGVLSGTAAAVFLISLKWATNTRVEHPELIWGLPIAGFVIGWIYHQFGRDANRGTNLILDEIHNPQKIVPVRMAPLVLLGTLMTHLFGGSAGREGTAVQMGASLSDQLSHAVRATPSERKILLMAGAGAGFAAAIGAPLAGTIFGIEVLYAGRLQRQGWWQCLVASFVGYYTAVVLGAPHTHFARAGAPEFSFKMLLGVAVAGVIFGLTARLFVLVTHAVESTASRWIRYAPLKPFLFGLLIVGLFHLEGSFRYAGLGLPIIQDALILPAHLRDSILKLIFTSLTIGSGFKGGEFIPLVFIGTTLGSALAVVLPASFQLLGSLGFAAVFGAAANTPLACSVMAMEIFGFSVAPYALLACFIGYFCSGPRGIYASQKRLPGPSRPWSKRSTVTARDSDGKSN